MTDFIALVIYASELAITGIILWFVCEFLPMPTAPKMITQCLIALVCILSVLLRVIADVPPPRAAPLLPPNPSSPSNPSSILK